MTPTASAAWTQLQAALARHRPACEADPRFILDDLDETTREALARICDHCPILDACHTYAPYAAAGYWAGRQRSPERKKR